MNDVLDKFRKEDLQELVDGEEVEGFEVVQDVLIETSRWSILYELVFKNAGKLYRTSYSVGATEQQDERPFEHDDDHIECMEVFAVEKTITVYKNQKGLEK